MGALRELELAPSQQRAEGPRLRLHVIYTNPQTTQASLNVANLLAHDLGATLELLVATVVPYPLPLNSPTAPSHFTEEFLSALVSKCEVDVNVKVLLCRDREETIPHWLPAESIAVIGRRRRWGPESSWRLIRTLRQKGHHVIVVDAQKRLLAAATFCRERRSR